MAGRGRAAAGLYAVSGTAGDSSVSLEGPVAHAGNGPARVELFVMALCPFGMQAEAALAPAVKAFGDEIDFRLYFIADEVGAERFAVTQRPGRRPGPSCEGAPAEGTGPFRSLHGDAEVAEGIRQTVMMTLYPDRYYDYILLRNRDIGSDNWEACARAVGMPPDRVAAVASGPEGVAVFRKNIRRANLLGIGASPTLLVNGKELEAFFNPNALARRICQSDSGLTPCQNVPVCGSDRDCFRHGKAGICIDPDRPTARCVGPVPFVMTVVNDPACAVCDTGYFTRATRELFPGVQVRAVAVGSPEGVALAARNGIDRVPAFILDRAFERTVRFGRFARTVRKVADGYVPDANMVPVSQLLRRDAAPGRVDLFVGLASPFAARSAEAVIRWLREVEATEGLRVHLLADAKTGKVEMIQDLRVREVAPGRYPDYLLCRMRGASDGQQAASPDVCAERLGLAPDRISGTEGSRLLEAERRICIGFGIPPGMNPVVVLNNRVVVTAGMMERIGEVFYRLNPELADRDRGRSQPRGP